MLQGSFLSLAAGAAQGGLKNPARGRFSPTSDGDTSQGLVVADFVVSVLMFLDAIVDFFAVNTQMIRNLEAELDLSSLYAEDTDADIVANMDTFSCAAIQYLHTVSPC